MTTKYKVELIDAISKAIDEVPALEGILTRERVLEKLAKKIIQLHTEKNHDVKNIAIFLEKNHLKCSQKEIKEILQNNNKYALKSAKKVLDTPSQTQ